MHLFSNDLRVIQNEETFEINTSGGTYIIIPTKYYPKRDVHEYLFSNPKGVDILETIRIATFQALHILNLFKTQNVIYNDFIFENLIVTENPITINSKLPFNVLVTDFANAQVADENGKSDIIGGTKIFNAPEIQNKLAHDYSVDIWSLGVNIYSYISSVLPFDISETDSADTIFKKTRENTLSNHENSIPEDAFDVISRMLKFDPKDRITPEEALKMSWFNGLEPII